jgi:hypothetical protein
MKQLLLVVFVFASMNAFSQSDNQVQEKERSFMGEGVIYLESGEEITGEIRHNRVDDAVVYHHIEGEKKPKKYKVDDIKEFTIGDSVLFIKIKSNTTTKLVQDIGYSEHKVKIYEATYQSNISVGMDPKHGSPTTLLYWIQFPGMKKAVSIKEVTLTKKKVASYVEDCPELSEKILNKESGYRFGSIIPLEKTLENFKRIADEYEACN